jgi:hypothetical protein
VAVATVSDSSGDQTLEVRKDKDKNYYAKSSVVEGIYKIPSDTGDALDKGLDDFRNKKLFDFGFSDPSKIELKGATYSKSGDKWMSGAKTMDNASVQSLDRQAARPDRRQIRRQIGRRPGVRGGGNLQ